MKLSPAFLLAAAAAAAMVVVAQSQDPCCSTDADCLALQSDEQMVYNDRFGKTLVCDMGCPGKLNCNMFGLCDFCRGCFTTCEGVMTYLEQPNVSEDGIFFCPTGEVEELSECYEAASGSGSGSASGSGTGVGTGSGSASGSGMGSASGSGIGSASGSGTGSASGSGMGYASGSGTGFASGSGTGSASGSGTGFASGSGTGSASGSGMGSASGSGGGSASGSGMGSASGSATSRIADIPGCTCGEAELDDATTAFFCDFGESSMYCDLECVAGNDPMDRLFPEMGGLWCKPFGYEGCRLCMFDCTDYDGEYCVPCPEGVKHWCP
ncbi:unnamed protein product [Ascophyllum nodosum]